MSELLRQDGEWMDAAIDEAVGSLMRGDAPIGLRREVLARIESRRPVMWGARRLAFGSMALAALAVYGLLMIHGRTVSTPRALLSSMSLTIETAPLPAMASGAAPVSATRSAWESNPALPPLRPSTAAGTRLAAYPPSSGLRVASPAVSTGSAGGDSAMAVRVSALQAPTSIDPPPLHSLAPLGPRPIAIDPIDLPALVVPPLGAPDAPEGDHQ